MYLTPSLVLCGLVVSDELKYLVLKEIWTFDAPSLYSTTKCDIFKMHGTLLDLSNDQANGVLRES